MFTRNTEVYSVMGVMFALSSIAVGVRLFTRVTVSRRLWLDDWLCIVVWFANCVVVGTCVWQVRTGTGRYVPDVVKSDIPSNFKAIFVWHIFYTIGMNMIKLSILAFYQRLSTDRLHRLAVYTLAVIVTLYLIIMTPINIFQCKPVSTAWNPANVIGRSACLDGAKLTRSNAIFNMVSDILIWALPIPVLWSLNLSFRRRMVLTCVFCVGIVAIMASAFRLNVVLNKNKTAGIFYRGATVITWTNVEINLGILCSCVPALRALYQNMTGGDLKLPTKVDIQLGNMEVLKMESAGQHENGFAKLERVPVSSGTESAAREVETRPSGEMQVV